MTKDVATIAISVFAVQIGVIYWLFRTFVTEKTCRARQDCVEAKVDSIHASLQERLDTIESLILKLIKFNGLENKNRPRAK